MSPAQKIHILIPIRKEPNMLRNNVPKTIMVLLFIAIMLFLVNQLGLYHISKEISNQQIQKNNKTETTVLFMVASYTDDFTRRNILRETYLSVPDKYEFFSPFMYISCYWHLF